MAVDRKAANMKMLDDTNDLQNKTKEAVWRMNRQAAEAEEIGTKTLDELRRQGAQTDEILQEVDSVSKKLDKSAALQNQFDRWAFNWLGGKKRAAMKEAAAEINDRNQLEHSKIKEVFQHEKYDSISRTWKKIGLVLCSDPTIPCEDLFDPALEEKNESSKWLVDFSLSSLDAEGWTYAYDFASLNKTGAGDSAPKWNSYVRRRKWKYVEKVSGGAALDEVQQRNEARKNKTPGGAAGGSGSSRHAEKLGYVPRNAPSTLTASGMTSAGMLKKGGAGGNDALDEESAAGLARVQATDAEIDAGLDSLANTMDRLNQLGTSMRDEVVAQNSKLDYLDSSMEKAGQKQTVVNARLRKQLKG